MLNTSRQIEAKLKFKEADFEFITHGDYVKCSVTGKHIDINNLKYWNHKQQKPYYDAKIAMEDKIKNDNINQ